MINQAAPQPENRTAIQIAWIALVGASIADLFYLSLAVQTPSWQLTALFLNSLILVAAAVGSVVLVRRGRTIPAMLLLVAAGQFTFAVASLFITDLGLVFGLSIAFITAMVSTPTLTPRQIVLTSITAAISGVISIVLDIWSPAYRLSAPPLVRTGIPVLVVVVIIVFSFFLVQQFRYSLRAKLLLGFMGIFVLAGAFGVVAVRQQAFQTQQAAVTEASNVAESIALSVGRYPASAQDYVAQLNISQHRFAIIVDLKKRILADPDNSAVYSIYNADPAGQVAATILDGQIRTFTTLDPVTSQTKNIIVAPVVQIGGQTTGAAIIDYTSLVDQLVQSTNTTQQALIILGSIGLILTLAMIQYIAGQIANPIITLRNAAVEIGQGKLNTPIPAQTSQDEIGTLTTSFSGMTGQLKDLIGSLEQHVRERTADLESANQQVTNRAAQLEAISKVSESVAAVRDLGTLLPQITRTISEQFGFYHVGIFLIDQARQYAVLQAANSAGGQQMLQRGHKLRIGQQGIVGYVAANGVPRIALDTGMDAVFFNSPDLPTTRSEMALPLVSGDQIAGVLDVQSEQPSAFKQDDVNVLTTLANQVSIAILNARLFEETSQALREARVNYEQYVRSTMQQVTEKKSIGYRFTGTNVTMLNSTPDYPEIKTAIEQGAKVLNPVDERQDVAIMTLPIKLRDDVIGYLDIRKMQKEGWGEDEVDIAEAIADRVAIAVENAALLEESQRLAMKERLIGEVTSKISSSINMRNVLQTAVEELGRALPGSEVIIQFENDGDSSQSERQSL